MSIKNITQENAEALTPSPTFRFGWKSFQNLKADGETIFPLVYLDAPIKSNSSLKKSGLIERSFNLTLFFGNKTKLGYTPAQHESIISAMYLMTTQFIQRLQKDARVHFVTNVRETEVINVFDINMSGIILELSVVPFADDSFCNA